MSDKVAAHLRRRERGQSQARGFNRASSEDNRAVGRHCQGLLLAIDPYLHARDHTASHGERGHMCARDQGQSPPPVGVARVLADRIDEDRRAGIFIEAEQARRRRHCLDGQRSVLGKVEAGNIRKGKRYLLFETPQYRERPPTQ